MAHALRRRRDVPPDARGWRPTLSVRARAGLVAVVLCACAAGWAGAGRLGTDPAAARGAVGPQAADTPADPVPTPRAAATLPATPSGPAGAPFRPAERGQVREAVAQRVDALHRRLRITQAEQTLWDQFADTMLRNALDSEGRFRARQAQPAPGAADGLAERAQAAQARADMLQHLSASFRALYEAMPPDQRLLADQVFRQAQRQEGRHGPGRLPQE